MSGVGMSRVPSAVALTIVAILAIETIVVGHKPVR